MYKLVVADMDGTLLNKSKKLDPDFIDFILKHPELYFVIASGRQYQNIKEYFPNLNLFYISDNGSFISDQQNTFITNAIDSLLVQKIFSYLDTQDGLNPIICTKDCAYISTTNEQFIENAKKYYRELKNVDDLNSVIKNNQVGKIAFYDPIDSKTNSYPKLKCFEKDVQLVLSASDWLDFNPIGISKGSAIIQLQKQLNIDKDSCIAFGDYLNDYHLFKACGHSVAMENAVAELKEIASDITRSNDDYGVSYYLNSLFK